LDDKKLSERQVSQQLGKLIKKILPMRLETFLILCEADSRGRGLEGVTTEPYKPGEILRRLAAESELEQKAKTPILQGRDLISIGLAPSKKFSAILAEVELQRERGRLADYDSALRFVKLKHIFTGSDLRDLGVEADQASSWIFKKLKDAILADEVNTREQASAYASQLIKQKHIRI
jgi:hypothetical protein